MNALLLIAHGSRLIESNNEVRELTKNIINLKNQGFDIIMCCFLELANPSIPEAINELALKEIKNIIIFPYFLASGAHVAEDIPEFVNEAKSRYPEINFEVLTHLGANSKMAAFISETIDS